MQANVDRFGHAQGPANSEEILCCVAVDKIASL